MKSRFFCGCMLLTLLCSLGGTAHGDAASTFKRLLSLKGTWNGTYEWSGDQSRKGSVTATYYLTGNGTAVVEDLAYGPDPVMTSVYHMDGDTLRMTHYCAAGNQPRFKAEPPGNDDQVIRFTMVDITNLPAPGGPHVNAVMLSFKGDNEIELAFTFTKDGKESVERLHLTRAKG